MCKETKKPFDVNLCQNCQVKPSTDEHTCPYKEDINDDKESLCNCCEDCEHNCAMDI